MNSHSNIKPPVLLNLGDGSYHYNYNVKSVTKTREDGQPEEGYEYETVHIWGTPTYDNCVKAVLRSRLDETEEFALINKYNAYKLGLSTDKTAETDYKAYLKEVLAIKDMVRADIEGTNKAE